MYYQINAMTIMKRIFILYVIVALLLVASTSMAGNQTDGFAGHKWGEDRPDNYNILFEQTFDDRTFSLCTDPAANTIFNGIQFENLIFRYIDNKLAGISYTKKGGRDEYEQAVTAIAKELGEPSATKNLKKDGLFQTYWNGPVNSFCLEFSKHHEKGQHDSIALNIAPAIKLGRKK